MDVDVRALADVTGQDRADQPEGNETDRDAEPGPQYLIEFPQPGALGEQKSKAAQLGIKRLMEAGIQPHIIACRAQHPVTGPLPPKPPLNRK